MRVVLLRSVSQMGDLVPFRAQVGHGMGRWKDSAAQASGEEIDVEIDFVEPVDWSDIEIVEVADSAMEIRSQGTEIRGVVSDLNEDGVLTLRLGDGEMRLDTTGEPPTTCLTAVRLTLDVVEIYPTGT